MLFKLLKLKNMTQSDYEFATISPILWKFYESLKLCVEIACVEWILCKFDFWIILIVNIFI